MVKVKPAQNGWLASLKPLILVLLGAITSAPVHAEESGLAPLYKPSGKSPQAMDIRLPAYGGSQSAPAALTIGDTVPDFVLPAAAGGKLRLTALRASGPVVIVFYRGHW